MTGQYERELKRLLSGDPELVAKFSRHSPGYRVLEEKPFLVVRAAGSFGIDLLAVRGDVVLPIEVKSTSSGRLRISRSGRLKRQYLEYVELARLAGVVPIYAVRKKGVRNADPWRIFRIRGLEVRDRRFLDIPEMGETKGGNPLIVWENGSPLSEFLLKILKF